MPPTCGLGRTVALKLVAEELAQDATRRERFKRESRIAASIDHPNVIPLYEAGEEDDVLFISMRWVDGTDLRAVIDSGGPLEPARASRLVAQIASALDAAHARDLIHRDVKPANVLIADDDHVYLTDFGLSKHATTTDDITSAGQWVGTVDYVAPEQIQGLPVTPQTDVYALGCMLYELLSGRVPYVRETHLAKLWAHVNAAPPSLLPVRSDLPVAFDRIVRRAMAKSPAERYRSAGELAEAVLAAAEGDEPGPSETPSPARRTDRSRCRRSCGWRSTRRWSAANRTWSTCASAGRRLGVVSFSSSCWRGSPESARRASRRSSACSHMKRGEPSSTGAPTRMRWFPTSRSSKPSVSGSQPARRRGSRNGSP